MSSKVITGKVRFSYANVHVPTAMDASQEPNYNVSILIDKNDKETVAKVKAAIEFAKTEGSAKLGNKIPANLKIPLRDGDVEKPDDEVYAGHYFINAKSSNKPGIVNKNLEPIMSQDEFYSGCYGRASINFYAYNTSGNKGIACGLNNLQFLEDGDRLSGGSSAQADFGEFSEEDIL